MIGHNHSLRLFIRVKNTGPKYFVSGDGGGQRPPLKRNHMFFWNAKFGKMDLGPNTGVPIKSTTMLVIIYDQREMLLLASPRLVASTSGNHVRNNRSQTRIHSVLK